MTSEEAQQTTLVLDAAYRPVARVPWERAVTLHFEGKVDTIESYPCFVSSPAFSMRMPSIIRFKKVVRNRRKSIKFSRQNVFLRDRGVCGYCGQNVDIENFTYDHVKPASQGGTRSWTNVITSCVRCNQYKGGRTPEQAGMRLRSIPHKPTSLPGGMTTTMIWRRNMPESWKPYLMAGDEVQEREAG